MELDRQQELNEKLKITGKMTVAEKQLNKDDLLAYKYYDGN